MILDKKQKEIVESDAKKIMVVAGSGSGKTRIISERVRYLLEERNVPPHELICITFTNAAADEMRSRLSDVRGIGDAFVGTIHSFANRVYKESGKAYQLFTQEVEMRLMKEVLQRLEYIHLTYDAYLEYLDLIKLIEAGDADPNEGTPETYFNPSELSDWYSAQRKLHNLRKERNIITFDELLEHTREYFQSLGASVGHVMLDEAQDVGSNEMNFVEGLDADNVFYVGDDYQNIYSWKGANVELFKNLMDDPEVTTYMLENNYRSAREIVEFADTIIKQVPDRIHKDIKVMTKNKGTVVVDSKNNVDKYLKMIRQEGNYNDWFVLCRTNSEVYQLSNKLRELNVPVDTFKRGGKSPEELEMLLALPTVKVLTVHVSKGLENRNVLLYGNFPLKNPSWKKSKGTYEERRVMYVGITRAEENLIVLN